MKHYHLMKSKADEDCYTLKLWERGELTDFDAMFSIESHNKFSFGSINDFIEWANGLGYHRRKRASREADIFGETE
jgi:hypothetical protein